MEVFLGYQSALEYWRIHHELPDNSTLRKRCILLPANPPTTEQVRSSGLTLPLHILLNNRSHRWESKAMKQHVFSGDTPPGSFFVAENGLEVSSPEFCFLQMAGTLSLPRLIELGYEFCGGYSLPIAGDVKKPDRGFYNRLPLTSIKKLTAFTSRMKGVKGCLKAVRALRYILEGSASPMETKLSILLTLPYKYGGFGFPKPVLNARVAPRKADRRTEQRTEQMAGRRITGKEYYVCDLYWPDHALAVEYDSTQFHTGSAHITDDSKKRNALTAMDIKPITVTAQQLYDSREFESVAAVLAKRIGKRLVYKNPGFEAAHYGLRCSLNIESGWQ